MHFSRSWWAMKARTLADIDHDLKVMRNVMLDTISGSKDHAKAMERIDLLLDERQIFTGKLPSSE